MTSETNPGVAVPPTDLVPLLALRNTVLFPGTTLPLTVGRPASVRALDQAARGDSRVVMVTQRNADVAAPAQADLFEVGTLAEILRMVQGPDEQRVVIVRGVERVRITEVVMAPFVGARVERIVETQPASTEFEARVLHLRQAALQAVELLPQEMPELVAAIGQQEDPARLADLVASVLAAGVAEKQQLLETFDVAARLKLVEEKIAHQAEVMSLSQKIAAEAHESIDKVQREYFLRKQLEAIKKELGEDEPRAAEFAEIRKKLEAAAPPEAVLKQALAELHGLERMPEGSAETTVVRNHLEWIAALPWNRRSEERIDLAQARAVLDAEHCGLEKVKRRILELLAVRKLKPGGKSPILCFVGPPGVGKTSLGRAIARATHREFVRQSLGGVHDESEIRGHRRTYVGALPGRILQGIRKAGTANPVFMLDEVDKLTTSMHGDPAAALLEVLDPEQNSTFEDHYLDAPFDLSGVLFIATANLLDPLPPALRDRMEVIELAGYAEQEKIEIAVRHLLPRLLDSTGLTPQDLRFHESAVREVIRGYTREAGVRQLERELATICRRVAVRFAEDDRTPLEIDAAAVHTHLGAPRFRDEVALRTSLSGVATGLAWTGAGGDILFVEATRMAGSGHLLLTGQLGDVMKESAQAAWSLVKSRADELGIAAAQLRGSDVHIHLPAGAIPKDGPSAGITLFVALASLFTGRRVRRDVAMTGEISLRGLVLPVGGIREKVLAARRAGITRLLLPELNQRDFDELPEDVRREVEVHWIDRVETALVLALEPEIAAAAAPDPTRQAVPSSICCALLLPHAPIVHPAVAGARAPAVRATTNAMRDAARLLVAHRPDLVVVVSPHARRLRSRWAIATAARLHGSLARFGAAHVRVALPIANDFAARLRSAAADHGEVATLVPADELDHGALVPLAFLFEAGWRGETLEIAPPGEPALESFRAMGRALASAAREEGRRCALVASGDSSHRLTPGAPNGYEPRARDFDAALARHLAQGELAQVRSIDPELVELAAEDVVASLSTAIAAIDEDDTGHRLLSYEAPFGVGYLVAVLHAEASAPDEAAREATVGDRP